MTMEPVWYLSSGEEVSLRINTDIFHPDGRLKGQARFSANRDSQLFTLSWPKLGTQSVSTLSRWHLVVKKATDDRISSFYTSMAENLGVNQWEAVKTVVQDCRTKFHARLLSLSLQEIVFAHEDKQSAERMKDSNEMVDVMNSLLGDLEFLFRDILVDWDVKVTPVTVSLSYQPGEGVEGQVGQSGSVILADASLPSASKTAVPGAQSDKDVQPYFQKVLDLIAAESKKTQDALTKMAAENIKRHRFLCQKVEELKSSLRHLDPDHFNNDDAQDNNSGVESDANYLSDSVQPGNTAEEESIPSAALFDEGPQARPEKPVNSHNAANNEQCHRQPQREDHPPKQPSRRNSQSSNQRKQHEQASQRFESTTEVLQKDFTGPSEMFRDPVSGCDLENRNIDEAVDRAYRHDPQPPPKAKSYYTILCLDVSESMKENGAFEEMRKLVEQIIDGVEDVVTCLGVEENIGVVTFGGTSNVVQNLTNDFSRVRDAIDNIQLGGRSPFVQALMVSMAAFVEKAGIISVSGVYDVHPRIIFISDGYPTENMDDGGVDSASNKSHVRSGITRLMMNFARKERYRKIQPVVYIPVGTDPDKELLRSMATLSEGQYMEPMDVQKLCGHFLVQETIGKTLACLEDAHEKYSEKQIKAVAMGLVPDLNDEQKEEVVKMVQKVQVEPSNHKRIRSRNSNLEDMYENTDKVNAGELLPLGTRVLRGPDWHWDDQDGNGPGTVISHNDRKGWTWVYWDFTEKYNRYSFGPDMGYEIFRTDDHPRLMGEDQEMKIGMVVTKGPTWCYDEEDRLKQVQTGIVIRQSRSQRKLMVRWDNAELQVVRYGARDKYDVMYCDPREIPQQEPLEFRSARAAARPSNFNYPDDVPTITQKTNDPAADAQDFDEGQWQWMDEQGQWKHYSPQDSAHIEKNYKKNKNGSCIINRDGNNRRVMFRRWKEKMVDAGTECAVRRIPVEQD